MTTGHLPFTGPTTAVTFDAILNKEPIAPEEWNPALPAEMARIIRKALEKDSELRYQSAADLRADLRRLQRDLTAPPVHSRSDRHGQTSGAVSTVTIGGRVGPSSDSQVIAALLKRHRRGVAVGVAMAALTVAVASYSLWSRRAPVDAGSTIALEESQMTSAHHHRKCRAAGDIARWQVRGVRRA